MGINEQTARLTLGLAAAAFSIAGLTMVLGDMGVKPEDIQAKHSSPSTLMLPKIFNRYTGCTNDICREIMNGINKPEPEPDHSVRPELNSFVG